MSAFTNPVNIMFHPPSTVKAVWMFFLLLNLAINTLVPVGISICITAWRDTPAEVLDRTQIGERTEGRQE